jgi:hypothetical protein
MGSKDKEYKGGNQMFYIWAELSGTQITQIT